MSTIGSDDALAKRLRKVYNVLRTDYKYKHNVEWIEFQNIVLEFEALSAQQSAPLKGLREKVTRLDGMFMNGTRMVPLDYVLAEIDALKETAKEDGQITIDPGGSRPATVDDATTKEAEGMRQAPPTTGSAKDSKGEEGEA